MQSSEEKGRLHVGWRQEFDMAVKSANLQAPCLTFYLLTAWVFDIIGLAIERNPSP